MTPQPRLQDGHLTKKKTAPRPPVMPTAFDQARDELFSHILRCGVLEAAPEHQKEWMDDTMQYIADRYSELSAEEQAQLRTLGERFCQPVVRRAPAAEGETDATETETDSTEPVTVEA